MKKIKQEMKNLDLITYNYYFILFKKDRNKIEIMALINSKNKVNKINPIYAMKLGLQIPETDINAQKIDYFVLKTNGIIISAFQIFD